MEIKEKQTKTEDVVVDVICNKCGLSLKRFDGQSSYGFNACIGSGYASPILPDDGALLEFDICEPCTIEFARTFKIPARDYESGATLDEVLSGDWEGNGLL